MAHNDSDRSWGTARDANRSMNTCVSRWLGTMLSLPEIHRRMMTVVVDNQDAVRCINQWDSTATMFYVDPPYIGAEDYYLGGFGKDDHSRLADALNRASGRVVVSYYPRPELEALYPEKCWRRQAVRVFATSSGNPKRSPGAEPRKMSSTQRRVELILTNFDPATRKRLIP